MEAALEREVSAWRLLHDPEMVGRMDREQVRRLCLRAGYSEATADAVAKDRDHENWKAGL